MDPDQPADLSMKRDRRPPSEPYHPEQPEPVASSARLHGEPSSAAHRDCWPARSPDLGAVPVVGGVLDLVNRGSRSVSRGGRDGRNRHADGDIIVLSDEDAPRMNGHVNGFAMDQGSDDGGSCEMPPLTELKELSVKEVQEREHLIRKLQENLRNEEMKLVLLKKLQQSHQMKENLVMPAQAAKLTTNVARGNNLNSAPSPLSRGAQVSLSKSSSLQQTSSHMMMPPLVRAHGVHGIPQSLLMSHRTTSSGTLPANVMLQQSMVRGPGIMGRIPVTTPPNVVLGYPIQSQAQSGSPSTTSSPSLQQTQQPQSERVDNQTPAQRQAAAKLALRKQLEKTLLQIPPPKPPPPEMHFIPNPNNSEFIYLVGLETVVNFITDDNPQEDPPKPFDCIQCSTDFTPVWKWSNPSKGTVTCEQCVTSNIKKALKAEHTNRLKTAFVKALQQEQEIEQRMSQVSSSPPAPQQIAAPVPPSNTSAAVSSTVATPSPSSVLQLPKLVEPLRQSHAAVAAAATANLTAAHQHMIRLSQHQPLPAHMLTSLSPLWAHAYQYQLFSKTPVTSPELQRQYLLDMIPPRSMPQGTINWKT